MHAARSLLQDSPIAVCASNRFISIGFHTLRTQWKLATPFSSITSALFPIQWQEEGPLFQSSLPLQLSAVNCRLWTRLSPLECAVTSKHRVLPGFGRSYPPVTSLECAVTQIGAVSPLECALTKKGGGRE